MQLKQKVYGLAKKVPKGRITTYKIIAEKLGAKKAYSSRAYRAVGNILNKNKDKTVPCHRIVKNNGRIGGFNRGEKAKIKLLVNEGVLIKNNKIIDFKNKLHKF